MIWVVVAAVIFAALVAAVLQMQGVGKGSAGKGSTARGSAGELSLPFRKVNSLLTPAEMDFYQVLLRTIGGKYVVTMKTRMADLLVIAAKGSERQSALGRVSQKHADFVLLKPNTLEPVLVIELDDASHQRERRQERDALVDQIYARAGLSILHIPVAGSYDASALAAQINAQFAQMQAAATQAGR